MRSPRSRWARLARPRLASARRYRRAVRSCRRHQAAAHSRSIWRSRGSPGPHRPGRPRAAGHSCCAAAEDLAEEPQASALQPVHDALGRPPHAARRRPAGASCGLAPWPLHEHLAASPAAGSGSSAAPGWQNRGCRWCGHSAAGAPGSGSAIRASRPRPRPAGVCRSQSGGELSGGRRAQQVVRPAPSCVRAHRPGRTAPSPPGWAAVEAQQEGPGVRVAAPSDQRVVDERVNSASVIQARDDAGDAVPRRRRSTASVDLTHAAQRLRGRAGRRQGSGLASGPRSRVARAPRPSSARPRR